MVFYFRIKLTKHPDKTSIGKISAGFDFLGYNLKTVENPEVKAAQNTANSNNKTPIKKHKQNETNNCCTPGKKRQTPLPGKNYNEKKPATINSTTIILRPATTP